MLNLKWATLQPCSFMHKIRTQY
uniref:Uncharacterized protein n=1 Tax=Anguilla anguilla TaxID=7936 RepID=A0A0E9TV24_ANGAN